MAWQPHNTPLGFVFSALSVTFVSSVYGAEGLAAKAVAVRESPRFAHSVAQRTRM
jgi:hypothetical protein